MTAQPTSGRIWRQLREEGVLLTLPSGHVARIRPVEFDIVAKSGKIPDFLTPLIEAQITGTGDPMKIIRDVGTTELMAAERQLKELFAKSALVSPRIVDDPQADDEISIDDINGLDLQFIMEVCQKPSDELRTFSEEQARSMEPVGNGNGLPEDSEPDAELEQLVSEVDGNPGLA